MAPRGAKDTKRTTIRLVILVLSVVGLGTRARDDRGDPSPTSAQDHPLRRVVRGQERHRERRRRCACPRRNFGKTAGTTRIGVETKSRTDILRSNEYQTLGGRAPTYSLRPRARIGRGRFSSNNRPQADIGHGCLGAGRIGAQGGCRPARVPAARDRPVGYHEHRRDTRSTYRAPRQLLSSRQLPGDTYVTCRKITAQRT